MPKEEQKLIRLSDVPRIIFDLSGITRSRSIVYAWANKGRQSYDGRLIKLKTKKHLGHLFTTHEWLMAFIEELGGY